MTVHRNEERKAMEAIDKIAKSSERQAVALEKIAEAMTEGTLTGVVNLLEQIDVTLSDRLVAIEEELK